MRRTVGWWAALGILAAVAPAAAQGQYGSPPRRPATPPQASSTPPRYAENPRQDAGPRGTPFQPLVPAGPVLVPRTAPQQTLPPPFSLSPQEEAQAEWVLNRWEQRSAGVKTFECEFTRFEYDGVFGDPNKPRFIDKGELKYAAPDKGLFRVKAPRQQHWICDGKSIFEYDFQKKQLIEHKLPPELQGKAIADGPLPFLFGAKAEQIKGRYYVRIVTPRDVKDQIWLEAYPRFQADRTDFDHATLILTMEEMQPTAVETVLPNRKSKTVFVLEKQKVNAKNLLDPFSIFENNWLHPRVPAGWTRHVEEAPAMQAGRPPAVDMRR